MLPGGACALPGRGERFRPARLLYALYRGTARPQLVVDVTPVWERRVAAIAAHVSQLDPAAGPATYLTHPEFLAEVEARARVLGVTALGKDTLDDCFNLEHYLRYIDVSFARLGLN